MRVLPISEVDIDPDRTSIHRGYYFIMAGIKQKGVAFLSFKILQVFDVNERDHVP
jgi:hypothetical protein